MRQGLGFSIPSTPNSAGAPPVGGDLRDLNVLNGMNGWYYPRNSRELGMRDPRALLHRTDPDTVQGLAYLARNARAINLTSFYAEHDTASDLGAEAGFEANIPREPFDYFGYELFRNTAADDARNRADTAHVMQRVSSRLPEYLQARQSIDRRRGLRSDNSFRHRMYRALYLNEERGGRSVHNDVRDDGNRSRLEGIISALDSEWHGRRDVPDHVEKLMGFALTNTRNYIMLGRLGLTIERDHGPVLREPLFVADLAGHAHQEKNALAARLGLAVRDVLLTPGVNRYSPSHRVMATGVYEL